MPTITRTLLKTALAYALIGMLLSTLWLINIVWPLHPLLGAVQPTAIHLIVMGWLTQLIIGIALWMFPPWSKAEPRGPEWLGWFCYGALNGGLLLRLVAEPANGLGDSTLFGWLLVVSAALQVIALWIFVGLIWSRVRGKAVMAKR